MAASPRHSFLACTAKRYCSKKQEFSKNFATRPATVARSAQITQHCIDYYRKLLKPRSISVAKNADF
jgi:hypothetical protein